MAITTTLYYPSAYLSGPLKESFGLTPVSPLKRTQMVTGRARQRRVSTPRHQPKQIWLDFSDARAQAFEAWFRDELSDGAAWFNIPLLTPVGLKITCVVSRIFIKAHARRRTLLEIYRASRTLGAPIAAVWMGHYPEWIVGSSLLDIALNKEAES